MHICIYIYIYIYLYIYKYINICIYTHLVLGLEDEEAELLPVNPVEPSDHGQRRQDPPRVAHVWELLGPPVQPPPRQLPLAQPPSAKPRDQPLATTPVSTDESIAYEVGSLVGWIEPEISPPPTAAACTATIWFRGGLVFKARRLLYHSTLGSRVIQKKTTIWLLALYYRT